MFLQLYDIQGGLRIVKFAARVRPSTDNPVIVGYPAKNAPVIQSRRVGFPRLLPCIDPVNGGLQFTERCLRMSIGKDGYTFNCGHVIGLTYGLCTSFNGTLVG